MNNPTLCKKCGKIAVYKQQYSGAAFCKSCFIESIENRIRKTISKYKMIQKGDKIVVGFSGGKDSMVLLYNLAMRKKCKSDEFELDAVMILEGIQGYREESERIGTEFCKKLGISLHKISFKEKYGATLDEIVANIKKRELKKIKGCTICGTLRRKYLHDESIKLKANKLAIGHNLDDQTETFLQNILRNDLDLITRRPVWGNNGNNYFISRIKPLINIPENEIALYAYYKGMAIQTHICPYSEPEQFDIMRKRVQTFLNDFENHSPEIKFNLLKLNENLYNQIHLSYKEEDKFNKCEICGEPTGPKSKICRSCYFHKIILE